MFLGIREIRRSLSVTILLSHILLCTFITYIVFHTPRVIYTRSPRPGRPGLPGRANRPNRANLRGSPSGPPSLPFGLSFLVPLSASASLRVLVAVAGLWNVCVGCLPQANISPPRIHLVAVAVMAGSVRVFVGRPGFDGCWA